MAKKIFAVVIILVMACASVGATYSEAMEEPAGTVFYDTSVKSVDGCNAEAENLWMLGDGTYTVRHYDGTNTTLIVEDGSWMYVTN